MAKFISGKDLEDAVYDIIWEAQETLLIVSPFIKLDDYFKKLFDKHLNNPKIHFLIVFGKNEKEVSRSLSKSDFEYFKNFLNISIVYVPNLHAKYYGNEKKGVITSINLYDYSFKNNIEFGVYSEISILNSFASSSDKDAWQTCHQIAEQNEAVFIRRPMYEKNLLSALLGKSYIKSETLLDVTDKFYSNTFRHTNVVKTISDFQDELELGSQSSQRPIREEADIAIMGFCIRTGDKIPFNLKRPYSEKSYRSWVQYGNIDYPENYCHKTGQQSRGNTSMRKPVL